MARILIVDDEIEIREVLKDMLQEEGFDVLEASNGEEAYSMYKQHDIDVVILDLIMPKKDGIKSIIDLTRDFQDVRIIVMSGGGFEQLNMAKRFGAQYVFSKPFRMKEMIDTVHALAAEKRASLPSARYIKKKPHKEQ
jgi:DNA-binding response OmpR family regulator